MHSEIKPMRTFGTVSLKTNQTIPKNESKDVARRKV